MDNSDDEDVYANNYYYFIRSLGILNMNANEQCELMEYSNVAWHIKDEYISNANAVLKTSHRQLSEIQRIMIEEIINIVKEIPENIIYVENRRDLQLKNMQKKCWEKLRIRAKKLMSYLELETRRVDLILNKKSFLVGR